MKTLATTTSKTTVSNWSGSVRFSPQAVETPASAEALAELIRASALAGQTVRAIGSGHSFSPLIETPGVLVSLDRLSGLVETHDNGDVTVQGGTKLWQLNQLLFEKGRALENLGDIDRQSIAGSVSTGTHGTGLTLGSISTQLEGLELVTGTGETVRCSRTEDAELFRAAAVSLGALGVITRARLRTMPAYRLKLELSRAPLEDTLARLPELARARHFEFFTFPYSDAVQLKVADPVAEAKPPSALSTFLNEVVMENGAFKLLSEIARLAPGSAPAIARLCGAFVSGRIKADWAHRIFSTPRWVRFQEMEYSVPAERMRDTVLELREMIARERIAVHFPIECRYVRGDDLMISPMQGRDSALIAIHMYQGMEYERYFRAAESIFLNHGGRPHWGKMNFLAPAQFPKLYPEWERFREIRRRLDPKGVFLNARLRAIFGEGGA